MANVFGKRCCVNARGNLKHWNFLHKQIHTRFSLPTKYDSEKIDYQSKYNKSEEFKIVNKLNTSSPQELTLLPLSKSRLQIILDRKNQGSFNSLADIAKLSGMGVVGIEKMCDSILNDDYNTKSIPKLKNRLKGQILDPVLEGHNLKSMKSACALFMDLRAIGWARIDKESQTLTDWNIFDFGGRNEKKLQLSNITNLVWSICQQIPPSDLFVMEASPTVLRSSGADANNPKSVPINLQKAQLVAMLASALTVIGNYQPRDISSASDDNIEMETATEKSYQLSSDFQHKVFYLRSTLPSRLFKTFLGNERISSQQAVGNLLDGVKEEIQASKIQEVLKNLSPLAIDNDIKQHYYHQMDVEKEILCQTLLLCVTFMELCVYKNPEIINTLGNKSD